VTLPPLRRRGARREHVFRLAQSRQGIRVLDFKQAADMQLLRALVRRADVFIQNLAPGAMERADPSSEEVRQENPRLITCAISGYGEKQRLRGHACVRHLVQGEVGVFALPGNASGPGKSRHVHSAISARAYTPTWGFSKRSWNAIGPAADATFSVSLFESVRTGCPVPILFNSTRSGCRATGPQSRVHRAVWRLRGR